MDFEKCTFACRREPFEKTKIACEKKCENFKAPEMLKNEERYLKKKTINTKNTSQRIF
jgi:hypothetical protein